MRMAALKRLPVVFSVSSAIPSLRSYQQYNAPFSFKSGCQKPNTVHYIVCTVSAVGQSGISRGWRTRVCVLIGIGRLVVAGTKHRRLAVGQQRLAGFVASCLRRALAGRLACHGIALRSYNRRSGPGPLGGAARRSGHLFHFSRSTNASADRLTSIRRQSLSAQRLGLAGPTGPLRLCK